eukprot:TRINITY_DN6756_c0_g1_i1.p1 TRINITY_DN6756_c0_g1~~TRINITY_DN6756_c0_g1_i1.p1  ORF type:complete len:532 (-),score=185.32 TRINITY_DN6756_c0_g1_i1:7-1602(-)
MASSNVTSGERLPVWFEGVDIPKYPSLGAQTITADVCVVGGGLAGVTSAYLLAREGKQVVLIEHRQLGSGETGRTTAQLMSAGDDRYFSIGDFYGNNVAKLAAESQQAAVDLIEQIVNRESIDCDFERVNGYLIPGEQNNKHYNEIEKEANYSEKEAQFGGVRLVERAPIADYVSGKSVLFPRQGQFHPLKYLYGVAKKLEQMNVKIYNGDRVTEAQGKDDPYVKTDNGGTVKCKDIIIATCNPSFAGLQTLLKQEPYRTYAITGTVPKGSVEKALIWDTLDPYHYVRISKFNDTHDYLISGGEDHPVGHPTDINDAMKPFKDLEKWTRERYPMLSATLTHQWSGEVWEPIDLLAIIGRNPIDPDHMYIISGDSGTGMTNTTLGAQICADLVMGRDNKYKDVYYPKRIPSVRATGQFVRYGLHSAEGFIARIPYVSIPGIVPGEVKDIEDIHKGCGGVMTKNGKKLAIYKGEDGTTTVCSAVCPHMGALLVWNDAEKSWDCTVHGSRFSKTGTVVNGPSPKDMTKLDASVL